MKAVRPGWDAHARKPATKPAFALAMVLLIALVCWGGPADAQSCTLTANMAFGSINPISGAPTLAQSTVTFNCTGFATPYVRACANLGDDTTTPRELTGPGGAKMRYGLYQDAARTTIWGSAWHSNPPLYVDIALSGGAGTAQVPFYGSVLANQTDSPVGSYSATITSATLLGFGYTTTPPTCVINGYTSSQSFQVASTGSVAGDCVISATNIDFGQVGLLAGAINTTGVITTTCTKTTAYTLSMNAGTGAGASLPSRKLTRSGGADTITYALYRDAARTQVWGDGTAGSTTVTGTGTGVAQTATVYGTIPAQAAPKPGTYNDTITVTVTF